MAITTTIREKRTPIRIGYQQTEYTEGEGAETTFELIEAEIGKNEDGEPIKTDIFYCEWSNSYGYMAIQQSEDGISQPARIRMPYVKSVLEALQTKDVRIYKNGIVDDDHTYELNSSADNYLEQNKMIEFYVKKYEAK